MTNTLNEGARLGGAGLGRRRTWAALALTGAFALSACDLSVVNPALIDDAELNTEVAVPGIIFGAISDVGWGMFDGGGGGLWNATAQLTDEVVHVGSWVGLQGLSEGIARDDWVESQLRYGYPAKARWVNMAAARRIATIREGDGRDVSRDVDVATAELWAGIANRHLGDAFCDGVRDGGPLEDFRVHYEEADSLYTNAIARAEEALAVTGSDSVVNAARKGVIMSADSVRIASHGGRAQVRLMLAGLNKLPPTDPMWDAILADAAMVPIAFQVNMRNASGGRNTNEMSTWLNSTTTREASLWGTPWYRWVDENGVVTPGWGMNELARAAGGDFRVAYDTSAWVSGAPPTGRGATQRPWVRARKWTSTTNHAPIITGREMRLIEAEVALIQGDTAKMVERINVLRTRRNTGSAMAGAIVRPAAAAALPMRTMPANANEAWFYVMYERAAEHWLEARRLADLRRWLRTPGREYVDWEGRFDVVRRIPASGRVQDERKVSVYAVDRVMNPPAGAEPDICIEIAQNERLANPNIPVNR